MLHGFELAVFESYSHIKKITWIVYRKFDVVNFVEIKKGVRFLVIVEDCETGCEDCNSLIALQATKTAGKKDKTLKQIFLLYFIQDIRKTASMNFLMFIFLPQGANPHMYKMITSGDTVTDKSILYVHVFWNKYDRDIINKRHKSCCTSRIDEPKSLECGL